MGLWRNHLTRRNTRAIKEQTGVIREGLNVPRPEKAKLGPWGWWSVILLAAMLTAIGGSPGFWVLVGAQLVVTALWFASKRNEGRIG